MLPAGRVLATRRLRVSPCPVAAGDSTASETPRVSRAVIVWLVVLIAFVFAMVIVGGITRLTGSGLSMVEWHPLMGTLPPLTDAEWQSTFARYQESPQFQQVNHWMDLGDFQSIFMWEYVHRVLGRSVGVVFIVPWLYFLATGKLRRVSGLTLKTALAFVLGGMQGLLGWYMVKSGLVDVPAVSHFRLAAHLLLAFAIAAWIFWVLLGLRASVLSQTQAERAMPQDRATSRLERFAIGLCVLVVVQIAYGAFVAGTKAGLFFADFPLMAGQVVPAGWLTFAPWWGNFLSNPITLHFVHRLLGFAVLFGCLWFTHRARRATTVRQRIAGIAIGTLATVQFALGVATVMTHVEIAPAVVHQTGALGLFLACLWGVYELRHPSTATAGADAPALPPEFEDSRRTAA